MRFGLKSAAWKLGIPVGSGTIGGGAENTGVVAPASGLRSCWPGGEGAEKAEWGGEATGKRRVCATGGGRRGPTRRPGLLPLGHDLGEFGLAHQRRPPPGDVPADPERVILVEGD